MNIFKPGDFVHKIDRHRFQGRVISSGIDSSGTEVVTVEHWPERWIFHFRSSQIELAKDKTYDRPFDQPEDDDQLYNKI